MEAWRELLAEIEAGQPAWDAMLAECEAGEAAFREWLERQQPGLDKLLAELDIPPVPPSA